MKSVIKSIILLLVAQPAFAVNLGFLQNTLLAEFNQEEAASFREFVSQRLDSIADQEVVSWQSDTSGMGGKLKIRVSFMMNEMTCRRSAFLLTSNSRKEQYIFDLCKTTEGWRFAQTPVDGFKNSDWEMLDQVSTTALEMNADSNPLSWFNKQTGNSGVIVALEFEQNENRLCRELAISVSDAKGLSSNGVYLFCKTSGNDWERIIEEL